MPDKDQLVSPNSELSAMRAENRRKVKAKLAQVEYLNADNWLRQQESAPDEILLAASGAHLPSLGSEWSLGIVVNPAKEHGEVFVNKVEGMWALDTPLIVYSGSRQLSKPEYKSLIGKVGNVSRWRFESIESASYDGAPCDISLKSNSREVAFSVNAADENESPSMALAYSVLDILQNVSLKETSRYEQPS